MLLAEPIQITQEIVEILEKFQIRYFIGGSLASSLHGIPRATQDVDIIADIQNVHVEPLIKELQKKFYVSESMICDAIQRHASFNVIHWETMLVENGRTLVENGQTLFQVVFL